MIVNILVNMLYICFGLIIVPLLLGILGFPSILAIIYGNGYFLLLYITYRSVVVEFSERDISVGEKP